MVPRPVYNILYAVFLGWYIFLKQQLYPIHRIRITNLHLKKLNSIPRSRICVSEIIQQMVPLNPIDILF